MQNNHQVLNCTIAKLQSIKGIKFMHTALFFAIFTEWQTQNYPDWVKTSRRRLLALSNIRSPVSYHKSINILVKHGIIEYDRSFHPIDGSKIRIILT